MCPQCVKGGFHEGRAARSRRILYAAGQNLNAAVDGTDNNIRACPAAVAVVKQAGSRGEAGRQVWGSRQAAALKQAGMALSWQRCSGLVPGARYTNPQCETNSQYTGIDIGFDRQAGS
eukprot:364795-Chlamydomonas_euryale.AAC.20